MIQTLSESQRPGRDHGRLLSSSLSEYAKCCRGSVRAQVGPGGPFHPETLGPWHDSAKVRSSAQVHSKEFRECVALQAQYVFDTFGKFPGTVPSMYLIDFPSPGHSDYFRPDSPLPFPAGFLPCFNLWHLKPSSPQTACENMKFIFKPQASIYRPLGRYKGAWSCTAYN